MAQTYSEIRTRPNGGDYLNVDCVSPLNSGGAVMSRRSFFYSERFHRHGTFRPETIRRVAPQTACDGNVA